MYATQNWELHVYKVIYKVNWKSSSSPWGKTSFFKSPECCCENLSFFPRASYFYHQMGKTTSWKDFVIMGLAFAMMIDTELGSESFTLIFHTAGCQRGSHLDWACPEKAPDWNEASTQRGSSQSLNAESVLKIKVITVVPCFVTLFRVCNICLSQQRE